MARGRDAGLDAPFGKSGAEVVAVLGLRFIHSQAATFVARATPDRKLAASLS